MSERQIPFELPDFCPPVCQDFSPIAENQVLYANSEACEIFQDCTCKNASLCTRLYEALAARKEDS